MGLSVLRLPGHRTLHEHAVTTLGLAIVQGDFAPVSALPDETQLAQRLGVSRGILREATKALAAKGLVETGPRTGTRVRPRSEWNLLDGDVLRWMLSASVDADLLTQLSEVRLLVEPSAVELAATRATTVDLAAIEAAYVAMTAGVDSKTETVGPNFIEADTAFHQAILRACHNELLEQLGRVIDAALRLSFSRTAQVPGAARGTLRLHGRIAEHLAKRDGPGAAKAMRALINQAIDDIAHLDHSVSYRRTEASRAAEAGGGRHTKGG